MAAMTGISRQQSAVSSQETLHITASIRAPRTALRTTVLALSATERPIRSTSEWRRDESPPGLFSSKKCTSCCSSVWNSSRFSLLFSRLRADMKRPPLRPENRELPRETSASCPIA